MPWQHVAGEVKDVASVDRPFSLQDSLADVIHPVDHHSILRGGRMERGDDGLFYRALWIIAGLIFCTVNSHIDLKVV